MIGVALGGVEHLDLILLLAGVDAQRGAFLAIITVQETGPAISPVTFYIGTGLQSQCQGVPVQNPVMVGDGDHRLARIMVDHGGHAGRGYILL